LPADSDTDPLTDVEYDNQPADSDAGGETPGSSLAAAGTSSQKRTLEITPPPAKKPKKQEYPELIAVLESFDLPSRQLEFTFEELFKAANMRNTGFPACRDSP
jgi:hypothetical protein